MIASVHVRGGKLWRKLMEVRERFMKMNCEHVREELNDNQTKVLNMALRLDVKDVREIVCFPSFNTIGVEMGVSREWVRQMFYRGLKKANINMDSISEKQKIRA